MQNELSRSSLLIKRSAAFFYDSLLLIALYFVITAIAIFFNDGEAIEHIAYKGFLLLVAFTFFDWCWRRGGQTLGMQAWRIRVISIDQQPITLKQSVYRFTTGTLLFGVTLLYILVSSDKRALHDVASKTNIVFYNK